MPDRQRMFLALWPDAAVRKSFVEIRSAMHFRRGRMVHPLDLHITLVFLGMVDAVQLPCVEAVAGRQDGDAFDLSIDHTGYWPRARVAWCGPAEVPLPLQSLVDGLQRDLRACGFEPEARPYRPHVTLARDARGGATGPLVPPVVWPCNRFVLVTSTGAREPPRYEVVRQWPLQSEKITLTDS